MQRIKILGATMLVCLVALVAAVTAGADESGTAPAWSGAPAQTMPVQESDTPPADGERGPGDDCPERDGDGDGSGASGEAPSQDGTPTPTPDV